nr:isoform 2 of trna (guanine(26)-n(2))-dimethyltransferase, mitochondrial [Quercus suber]
MIQHLCLRASRRFYAHVKTPTYIRVASSMAAQRPVPLSAPPAAGQSVEHDGIIYNTVREGKAYILVPPNARTSVDPKATTKAASDVAEVPQNVFYNPIQQFNRDLSVLAIKAFGEHLCTKKRQKYEQGFIKNVAKKDRKRKRKEVKHDGEHEETEDDGGAKLRKTVDGEAVAPGDVDQHVAGQARASGVDDETSTRVEQGREERNEEGLADPDEAPGSAEALLETKTQTPDGNGDVWKPRFRILDALSATGLRALRYAQEIPFATDITANDMDKKAVKSIRLNVQHNKLSSTITPTTGNAMAHMYGVAFPPHDSHGPSHISNRYDVIDLDPYGTAAPFIDSSLQALADGGMLCVTCTDSGVFASCGYSEKTFSLYGGIPVKGSHSHEGGLRIILHSIASSAAKYGLSIEPLLSLSVDFYVRMFIRVRKRPANVKFLAGKTMVVYACDSGCGAWTTQMFGRNISQKSKSNNFLFKHTIAQAPTADRLCEHCGSKTHVAGPMWAGPLHNAAFVSTLLKDAKMADAETYKTKARIEGMLDTALDELSVIDNFTHIWEKTSVDTLPQTPPEVLDLHPFFFIPSALAKVIHCVAPGEVPLKGAIRHAGYRATRSHCKPGSIKTNAPWSVIWEIMREWVRQKSPIKEGALKETSPGYRIMSAARKDGDTDIETESHVANEEEDSKSPVNGTEAQNAQASASETPSNPKRITVVFDEALGREQTSKGKIVRYQQNPRENWGPMARAKGSA